MHSLNHSTYLYPPKCEHSLPPLNCLARRSSNSNKTLAAKFIVLKITMFMNFYFTKLNFLQNVININQLIFLHKIKYRQKFFYSINIIMKIKALDIYEKITNRWIFNPNKIVFTGYIVQSNPVSRVGTKFFSINNDKRWWQWSIYNVLRKILTSLTTESNFSFILYLFCISVRFIKK